MFNLGIYVGRLTADPELRHTQSGVAVVNFTVACDRQFKSEGQPTTDFIRVVAWNKLAELCAKYLSKGKLTLVVGENQTRSWEDNDGKKHYQTECKADVVKFLSPKDGGTQTATDDDDLPI